ncbi:MAG: efflux RND transporter permease subunit [Spirochaetaceae bacterium]|jgi:multidrug efflux pump subunit AcrB|nr:efflux RND transporter permease subunit [Spirochaetaceae bacterium]
MVKRGLIERPVTALCLAAALAAASVFVIARSFNRVQADESGVWTLNFRHYGVDMEEMERSITIPLEDALSSIDGVKNIVSMSENGRVRVSAFFNHSKSFASHSKQNGVYEAVRDAAQRVYETLPSSAQKPEIFAADSNISPVWSAAVFVKENSVGNAFNLHNFLEKIVKPSFAGLEGAANVEIAGSGITEIIISLHEEEAARLGLSADYIAQIVSQNDVNISAGFVMEEQKRIPITVASRYINIEDLKNALIPLPSGGITVLDLIADIEEHEREADTITRLNGTKAAVVSVLPNFDANKGALSKVIKNELKKFSEYPVEFIVLADRGEEEAKAFRSALFAALQAALAVAVLSVLLTRRHNNSFRRAAACALFIPLTGVCAAALLSAAGARFDKTALAGLAAGIGAAVDAALLCAEKLGGASDFNDAKKEIRTLAPPLVSGALTTIIALLPLLFLPFNAPEVTALAAAIAAVTFVAMLLSLTIFPALVINKNFNLNVVNKNDSEIKRYKLLYVFLSHPHCICILALLVSVSGVIALLYSGVSVQNGEVSGSLFARVEFEGGLRAAEADARMEEWARRIITHNGIIHVQTGAQVASGNVLISYDAKIISNKAVCDIARNEPIEDGFVYINETVANEASWEIKVFGDSSAECREIAKKAANVCYSSPLVRQAVLNFKEGSPRLLLKPEREKIAALESQKQISLSAISAAVRNAVFGPVIYKRIDKTANTEVDVRIKGAGNKIINKNEILNIALPAGENGQARLQTFVNKKEETGFASLNRSNRRRSASITIRTAACDPRKIRNGLLPVLNSIELPRAYSIEFDPDAIMAADNLSKSILYFLLALLFCYIVISAANESFLLPFIVLAVVPPSVAVPVCIMTVLGIPINSAALCAFIAVSGLAVNAAVLVGCEIKNEPACFVKRNSDEQRELMHGVICRRVGAVIATSVTTIASALPFLFLRENANGVIRTLSVVTASGVGASAFFALTLVPVLMRFASGFFIRGGKAGE